MARKLNNLFGARTFGARTYTVLRVLCLVMACACVAVGALLFAQTTQEMSRAQTVATQMVQTQPKANALIVASYDDSDNATGMQRDGIIDVLRRSSVAVDVEYLGARGLASGSDIAGSSWGRAVSEKIKAQMAQGKTYAVVFAIDDEALSYVEQTHDMLFQDIPVVFLGIDDESHAQAAFLAGYATGIVERYDINSMIATAQKMCPNVTGFLAVTDNTAAGKSNYDAFQKAVLSFSGMAVRTLNASETSRENLAATLSTVKDDTIIFYLDAANDIAGNAYSVDDSAYFISQAANQPVFRAGLGGVGEGVVGSGYVDYEVDGQRAAQMAISILNGTRPTDIAVQNNQASSSVFDTAVMARYGISTAALPGDAVTLGQSGISFDSIRPIVLPVLLLLLGIALIGMFTFLGYKRSVSSMREIISQRNQLERSFYTDHLTDMPNMQWLTVYAGTDDSSRVYSIVEVALLGMDEIVSSHGTAAADCVIKAMAERLDGLTKEFLVRTGEASFIIGFAGEITDDSDAMCAIKRLLDEPVAIATEKGAASNTEMIKVESHIVVFNRESGMSIQEMVAGVDLAVRQTKDLGIDFGADRNVIFYDSDMRKAVEDKLEITALLKKAVANDDFVVVYQPQVNLQSNDVVAYEALVRLKNNAYPPEQFIPIAETNGLIVDIGRIVAKKVVQQLATWRKRNKRLRPVSINYSVEQLKDETYVDYLVDLLRKYDVSPSLIIMEISEVLFVGNMIKTNEFLEKLKAAGIRLAIDDFGVGYTSISRVISIPADVVKIDRTLTQEYLRNGADEVIQNLVRLVTDANKHIVIEGVETQDQLNRCIAMNCDVVQGHYYSEPMLPERAVQYKPPKR